MTLTTASSHVARKWQRLAVAGAVMAILNFGVGVAHAQRPGVGAAPASPINEAALAPYGGYRGLGMMTEKFVERVSKNPKIASFFKDAELDRLASLLTEQFCDVLGGGCRYTGKSMKEAHAGMKVRLEHFNALAEDLQAAMTEAGYSQAAQRRLVARLAPMQREVVE